MYVVMIAPECAPVVKAGGLGDVIFGLSREVEIRGHAVEILLPKYRNMRYQDIWDLHVTYRDLWVPWFGGAIRCDVWFGHVYGRKCFFIEPHSSDGFFVRERLYGYDDDVDRFAFFSKAALEFLLCTGKRPEVIHCHDWETGLVPVLLYEQYQPALRDQRVCFTVHNFGYQGATDERILAASGLGRPDYFRHPDRLGDGVNGNLNLMRGGIVYANYVTTVSPEYATEARFHGQAKGLGHVLHVHREKFTGVLNGLDYHSWNPETDPMIPARYTADDPEDKRINTAALRERFGLRDSKGPVVAYVGRIDRQKGMRLVQHAMFNALANDAQFVVLGGSSHQRRLNEHFGELSEDLNGHPDCHIEIGYTEELAHLVYSGADILVVPSLFEPCGLAPLTALRYGTVPVVRATGGMVDTIFDRDNSTRPEPERTGYTFRGTETRGIAGALSRALNLWFEHPDDFRQLMVNGMRRDHSWAEPGLNYINIYDHIKHK